MMTAWKGKLKRVPIKKSQSLMYGDGKKTITINWGPTMIKVPCETKVQDTFESEFVMSLGGN